MFKAFKEFALGGSLIDMATGIILGAAFGTAVKSLVDNVFMPVIGKFMGGFDFSKQYINLSDTEYATLAEAQEANASVLMWGQFVQDLISFLIVAFVIFILVKKIMASKEEEEEAPPAEDVVLLGEIRDLLKK